MSARSEIREFATNPFHLTDPLPDVFDSVGLEIDRLGELLEQLGVSNLDGLVGVLGPPDPGGVQNAPTGVIQDPAGSAVGGTLGGGGSSGKIYKKFLPELEPIPWIEPRSAIFNTSIGKGQRVLHTHSPKLQGVPSSAKDRRQVLEDLANSYSNALEAFRVRAPHLDKHGKLLNLVPVSAAIYAGSFADKKFITPNLRSGHLRPSYTICAVVLALDWSRRRDFLPQSVTIHFWSDDNRVYEAAKGVMEGLAGTTD